MVEDVLKGGEIADKYSYSFSLIKIVVNIFSYKKSKKT